MIASSPRHYSVRQCGPGLARGLARDWRHAVAAKSEVAFDRVYGALMRRICVRLRRCEAHSLLRRMRTALRDITLATSVATPEHYCVLVVEAEDDAMYLTRATAEVQAWPCGGFFVASNGRRLASISHHVQQRLHLRLSTADWTQCAQELVALDALPALAPVARAHGLESMWLPSPHGAFCVALDGTIPTVMTFIDQLNRRQQSLVAPVRESLAQDDPAAAFDAFLRRLSQSHFGTTLSSCG